MSAFRAVTVETLLVALFAAGMALLANALSPRGLQLGRDYFPRPAAVPAAVDAAAISPAATDARNATGAVDKTTALLQRLEQHGLRAVSKDEVVAWFRDPQHAQGLIVFVDARDDAHYRAGHIPGAWQFNHYRPEEHLSTVLPACLVALKVVVYCAGGDCEDSEFAAVMLRDAGVPRENLFVYLGGMAEWTANQLPVEAGARGSGPLPSARP